MKSRFTCLDVFISCRELANHVIGSRLQNVYDINSKTFLLKLNPKNEEGKLKLIIESGTRIHGTGYDYESSKVQPSFFAMKLRKWLRDRRITGFAQMGFDRVVHFEFGHQNPSQILHLYVEFYASGNIVLTDNDGIILLILRVVTNAEGEATQRIGLKYEATRGRSIESYFEDLSSLIASEKTSSDLKQILKEKFSCFSNPMINYLLGKCNDMSIIEAIANLRIEIYESGPGYITAEEYNEEDLIYIDFHPLKFASSTKFNRPLIYKEFNSFNEAADEFFSKIERRKSQNLLQQQTIEAKNKLNAIRLEQESRINGLEDAADLCLRQADMINLEHEKVSNVIAVIRAALDAGMDWKSLEYVIECEQKTGNPTALLMKRLKLESSKVEILLNDIEVDIDVTNGPLWNATRYYDLNRTTLNKLERTKKSFEAAMKSAEKKIKHDISQSRTKVKRQQVLAKRKHLWFEKFNWFISSDNFLVICGRDMQQNELLVKRYLKEGDVYVHADIHGAASVIVKGRKFEERLMDIPPRTLSEAGSMSLCYSRAWESKIVTSAWWAYAKQVSKTAPSGEFLPTGSFMIRGKKNFLPPSQLVYCFGFMFVLDDEAKEKRRRDRIDRDKILSEGSTNENYSFSNDASAEKYMSLLEITGNEQGEVASSETAQIVKGQQPKKQRELRNCEEPVKGKKQKQPTKGKQKRIHKKYADQDEEEREVRLKLLGQKVTAFVPEKKEISAVMEATNESKPQPKKTNNVEQDIYLEEEDEKIGEDELGIIDAMAGDIKQFSDHVQYAVPVCGPISALTNHTFRVKIVPGSLKRGKAVQQAISILSSEAKDFGGADVEEEFRQATCRKLMEMMKSIPDSDLNQTMLGHVKIMASAKEMTKVKSKTKPKKK